MPRKPKSSPALSEARGNERSGDGISSLSVVKRIAEPTEREAIEELLAELAATLWLAAREGKHDSEGGDYGKAGAV